MPPGEELARLGATGCTLVLHLAVQQVDRVAAELLPHYGPDCPAAVVARASWPDEVVLRCTLAELAERVAAEGIRPAVDDWRRRRAELWARTLRQELGEGDQGGFLVWGDPSLYDSTLDVLERIRDGGDLELDWEVVPGISSVQALAASHRIPLNRVGGPVHITTGRRLADGFPDHSDDVVVMLDAACSFEGLADQDLEIYWGAYLGTEDELLVAGKLGEVAAEIKERRRAARERKGWIMDTYLLRRPRR